MFLYLPITCCALQKRSDSILVTDNHNSMKEQLMHNKEKQSLYFQVAADVWGTKDIFVNMYIIRNPNDNKWVLVDAGLKSSAAKKTN